MTANKLKSIFFFVVFSGITNIHSGTSCVPELTPNSTLLSAKTNNTISPPPNITNISHPKYYNLDHETIGNQINIVACLVSTCIGLAIGCFFKNIKKNCNNCEINFDCGDCNEADCTSDE